MKKEPQKLKIVRDVILESHKFEESLLNNPQIRQIREIGKIHLEALEQARRIVDPITRNISQKFEQFSHITGPIPTIDRTIFYKRPIEHKILDELREINKNNKRPLPSQEDDKIIIYDTKDGSLNRYLGGKRFSYDLTANGKRKKLLDTLLDHDTYVQTKDLKEILSCPSTTAVAKVAQTFNDYAINTLRLDTKTKLIKGRGGSGYHINPKIRIEKV